MRATVGRGCVRAAGAGEEGRQSMARQRDSCRVDDESQGKRGGWCKSAKVKWPWWADEQRARGFGQSIAHGRQPIARPDGGSARWPNGLPRL